MDIWTKYKARGNVPCTGKFGVLLWCMTLLLSACLQSPMPAPTPTSVPAPTAMILDSATGIASQSMDIAFPADWTTISLQGENISQQLDELQDRGEAWEAAVNQLQSVVTHDSTVLVALYEGAGDSAMQPNLSAMLLPRNGLSLQAYLNESQRVLGETDGVIIEVAEFDDGLLSNGAPAATLHYRLENGESQVSGYQVLFFDESAKQVVVMTFAAALADFEVMLPIFREVVQGYQK